MKTKCGKSEDILEGADIVKFMKSLGLRWCGHIERMNNERMPKKLQLKWKERGKEEDHVKDG
jgi:hypothetical protein